MPKLVYVKQPAEREERLAGLVARIRDDDTTSYKPFSTADELGELVESDLAILLAERFDASRSPAAASAASATADAGTADDAAEHLPLPPDEVLGRETDLMTLLEWLGGDDPRRLVTLVGPGGIGKTRLSIEAARLARDRFDRVTFVALEHVRDPEGVLPAVARALGVRDDGGVPTLERLALARRGRRDLIVLDNFEQVVSAAPQVTSILTELPDATVLVTSRARLRVHAEQVFDVEPLRLPMDPDARSLAEIADAPAVRLFLDRAHAADARFDLTAENAEDVARICRTLDGVPLAIELAAACIRVLTPTAMLAKLDRVLSDPRRPPIATCRNASARSGRPWSGASTCSARSRVPCSCGSASSSATSASTPSRRWPAARCGPSTCPAPCSSSSTAACCASTTSEVSPSSRCSSRSASSRPCGSRSDEDADAVRRAHAAYYVRLAEEIEPLLRGSTQQAAVERVEAEGHDVRAAFRHLIAIGEVDTVADAAWRMLLYWWIRNLLPTAKSWTDRLLESGVPLTDRSRAIAITFSSWVSLVHPGTEVDREPLIEAAALFHAAGDRFGEGAALTVQGIACATASTPDLDHAEELQRRAFELVTWEDRRDLQLPVPGPARRHRAPARPRPARRSRSSTRSSRMGSASATTSSR